ncbi:sodium:alanine symporter family protein, partial [Fusicatenibacter saccharivorans]|nr:sodium:alanine symporter family protein [Fusicatenibacter saccharivorans]
WLWLYPILIILVGGGITMSITLRFFQITKLPFILKETFGKIFKKGEGDGTITPFQAATSALASTIGAANIVGVPL